MQRTISDEQTAVAAKGSAGAPEIPMQAFSDGLPPAPPVKHSWKRIDRWAEDNYEELLDNLGDGCTQNDINELEHELDCTLPMEVRESLQVHDGQERGGRPTGIVFGSMLLDCEEIVQEWKNWRKVNEEILAAQPTFVQHIPSKAFDGQASSSAPTAASQPPNSNWREELLTRQDSQPSNAVQKAYAHSSWIPLARDWGGNNLAVDLAPGPGGKWGQVILMGRDYDCKFVIARSWAAFLATVADDLCSSKVFVNEESGELKLREFRQQNVEPGYLDILRWRSDQKYGRKPPRRRPGSQIMHAVDPRSPPQAPGARSSPYASPTSAESDRGRSPHRFAPKGMATSSPLGVSSPLARVAEEAPAGIRVNTGMGTRTDSFPRTEKLISADTPRASVDSNLIKGQPEAANGTIAKPSTNGKNKENLVGDGSKGLGIGVKGEEVDKTGPGADEMKTVEI